MTESLVARAGLITWWEGHDWYVLGLTKVRIVGPSMEPEIRNGDTYIAATGLRPRVGGVVVLRHPDRPNLLTVKRVVREESEGWWVEGDNPEHSTDSRQFGLVSSDDIIGRLLVRIGRRRR